MSPPSPMPPKHKANAKAKRDRSRLLRLCCLSFLNSCRTCRESSRSSRAGWRRSLCPDLAPPPAALCSAERAGPASEEASCFGRAAASGKARALGGARCCAAFGRTGFGGPRPPGTRAGIRPPAANTGLSLLVNHLVGQQDGLADLASSGTVALNARGLEKREKLQSFLANRSGGLLPPCAPGCFQEALPLYACAGQPRGNVGQRPEEAGFGLSRWDLAWLLTLAEFHENLPEHRHRLKEAFGWFLLMIALVA